MRKFFQLTADRLARPGLGMVAALLLSGAAMAAAEHTIYMFGPSPDGATPAGGLTLDHQRRLYGVTSVGGAYGYGTVYRLTPSAQDSQVWTEEILHSFTSADGYSPVGAVLVDNSGAVFGVTQRGGPKGGGTVYRLDYKGSGWVLTTLHGFDGAADGNDPYSGVTFGAGELLYGATGAGGAFNGGTAYYLSTSGDSVSYKKIHDFGGGSDGNEPLTNLFVQADGSVIGTTAFGGGSANYGTVFRLYQDTSGAWQETILHTFVGFSNDLGLAEYPQSFVQSSSGTFFGCGQGGGPSNNGGVFSLTPPTQPGGIWTEATVYFFGPLPDAQGNCQLNTTPSGTLIGTSINGGTYEGAVNYGTFFTLTPPGAGSATWSEQVIYSFRPKRGTYPQGAPILHGNNYYGTTQSSGVRGSGPGLVFRLSAVGN